MKWTNDHGCYYLEGDSWLLQPIEEWSQFFESCNWYTFNPIKFEIENDTSLGGFEITVILLGVGLRWRWNHSETELSRELTSEIAAIERGEVETTPINLNDHR